MNEQEMEQLLLEWMAAKGGAVTDGQFADLTACLEEHFADPETTTLEEARKALALENHERR